MKNLKKWITSPVATVLLFVAAAGLLLFSTIGGARAAFLAISETYTGQVEMFDIGVTLMEKSPHSPNNEAQPVAYRNYVKNSQDEWNETPGGVGVLLDNLLAKKDGKVTEPFVPGKTYLEEISVRNTGTINEWVRVTIYKYWTRDPNHARQLAKSDDVPVITPELSPDLIQLGYTNVDTGDGKGDWILDKEASSQTEERTVYYYNKLLESGKDTSILTNTLKVDDYVASKVSQRTVEEDGYKKIITSYDYDGWQFCIEATVDAVQERNAVDAIKSAWGRDVSFRDDGTMVLE